jgi:predicted RNase H-like HicB family nuclease
MDEGGHGWTFSDLVHNSIMMKDRVVLHQSEEGYSVSCPGLPGCWSQGATEEEALENIRSAISEYLDVVFEMTAGETVREVEIAV